MKLNLKIFLFVVSLCFLSFAQKREIQFDHYTFDEGLSSNSIFCTLQDSRGFLWIGTYNGLNRYDGYKFIAYKNSPDDTLSLSENKVRALYEDKFGNIWIGTWGGGLNKFIRDTEKFIHSITTRITKILLALKEFFLFVRILQAISGLVPKAADSNISI